MSRTLPSLLAGGIIAVAVLPAAAQTNVQPPVVYKLDNGSAFQRGCFPPCDCPIGVKMPVRGTFLLTPVRSDPLFQYFAVTNVKWAVTDTEGSVLRINGSGTFKIGGEVAVTEELSLDLVVGSDPSQHFDSGLVAPSVQFPLLDLSISIHGGQCFDTVIQVRARLAPTLHVDPSAIWWDPDPTTSAFDVVGGDLWVLLSSGGDFGLATAECLAAGVAADTVPFAAIPTAGSGVWVLMREQGDSYDSWDTGPVASRDAGIDSAPMSCP
jgi:hypothetical protein